MENFKAWHDTERWEFLRKQHQTLQKTGGKSISDLVLGLHDKIRLPEWSKELSQFSWPFKIYYLDYKLLKDLYFNYEISEKILEEIITDFQNFLNNLGEEYHPYFIKIGDVSPKDMIGHKGLQTGFTDASILKLCLEYNSERVANELTYWKKNTSQKDIPVIVRPFMKLQQRNEFRIFVEEGEVIGISQMFKENCFAYTEEEKETIKMRCKRLVKQAHPHIEVASYVIDAYLDPQGKEILIEINPYAPTTDPILFRDGTVMDGRLYVVE